MLAVPPAWQLGSQEFPEPTAIDWLRNMPLCGKAYTGSIGLCNLRSLWPSFTSIKVQNCVSGGSSRSALPASSSRSCTGELASSGNGPAVPVSDSRWYQGNGLEELYYYYPGLAMDISLSKLQELVMDGEVWLVAVHAVHGVTKRWTQLSELNWGLTGSASEMDLVIAVVTDSGQPAVFTWGALTWQNKSCHFSKCSLRPGG